MSVGMLPAPDLHDKRTSEQALYLDESDDQRTVGNTAATAIAAISRLLWPGLTCINYGEMAGFSMAGSNGCSGIFPLVVVLLARSFGILCRPSQQRKAATALLPTRPAEGACDELEDELPWNTTTVHAATNLGGGEGDGDSHNDDDVSYYRRLQRWHCYCSCKPEPVNVHQ